MHGGSTRIQRAAIQDQGRCRTMPVREQQADSFILPFFICECRSADIQRCTGFYAQACILLPVRSTQAQLIGRDFST